MLRKHIIYVHWWRVSIKFLMDWEWLSLRRFKMKQNSMDCMVWLHLAQSMKAARTSSGQHWKRQNPQLWTPLQAADRRISGHLVQTDNTFKQFMIWKSNTDREILSQKMSIRRKYSSWKFGCFRIELHPERKLEKSCCRWSPRWLISKSSFKKMNLMQKGHRCQRLLPQKRSRLRMKLAFLRVSIS